MARAIVTYRRVSTRMQGQSGLGLDAQESAVQSYAASIGGRIVAQFVEVETATKDEMENRPELAKAIARAKRERATLVIAKLDRLSRSVYVTATLHRAGVDFVCCDNPTANRLTIQILAVIAENEARAISQRVRDALAAYKSGNRVSKRIQSLYPGGVPHDVIAARAGKLGAALPECRNLSQEGRARGLARSAESRRNAAIDAMADLSPGMLAMWTQERMSLRAIADRLNADGQRTRRGSFWTPIAVKRVLDRVRQVGFHVATRLDVKPPTSPVATSPRS
jgi:DNA invertase Pin-like site-specific DNA recombinase